MGVLNLLSPGVLVREIDLSGIIPAVSSSVGAYVGQFSWGPCDIPMLLDNEETLVLTFGKPIGESQGSFIGTSFFSCANFLAYSLALYAVRTVSANANNATANGATNPVLIKNENVYDASYKDSTLSNKYGSFAAKFPGTLGNSLRLSICANADAFSTWSYKNYFDNAPSTSEAVSTKSGRTSNDEMHIVVVDSTGKFSGVANTVLEKFAFVSKASDAIDINGQTNYYKEVIRQKSNFVFVMDHPDYANTNATWGALCTDTTAYAKPANQDITLSGGANGSIPPAANINQNWALFNDKDRYEISLAFVGASADVSMSIPQYVYDNVITGSSSESPTVGRRDTVLFVSPRYSDVVNQPGYEAANICTGASSFLETFNRYSSYIVADCNWKQQFDMYNNLYRWVPCNADIAGLCAHTDYVAEPWYSPAGFNRGHIKNVTKLAWNPELAYRDLLYKNGVNPVLQFVGEGTVLFGDKTLQRKPSALDRINVRRLLIVLEKAVSRAAKYQLFEFNDQFTRASFVAMTEPFLRTVQSRRGLYSFKVICDETNNTPDIIDRNAFVAHIMLQPTKSINFIELNFVVTRTGVDFTYVYKSLTGAS
jgi:phage tail sheath protein FI